jgi:hypothetical protein
MRAITVLLALSVTAASASTLRGISTMPTGFETVPPTEDPMPSTDVPLADHKADTSTGTDTMAGGEGGPMDLEAEYIDHIIDFATGVHAANQEWDHTAGYSGYGRRRRSYKTGTGYDPTIEYIPTPEQKWKAAAKAAPELKEKADAKAAKEKADKQYSQRMSRESQAKDDKWAEKDKKGVRLKAYQKKRAKRAAERKEKGKASEKRSKETRGKRKRSKERNPWFRKMYFYCLKNHKKCWGCTPKLIKQRCYFAASKTYNDEMRRLFLAKKGKK